MLAAPLILFQGIYISCAEAPPPPAARREPGERPWRSWPDASALFNSSLGTRDSADPPPPPPRHEAAGTCFLWNSVVCVPLCPASLADIPALARRRRAPGSGGIPTPPPSCQKGTLSHLVMSERAWKDWGGCGWEGERFVPHAL